ncbi:acyltransferase [Pedobacter psychroterrae]|uniref:Acyltransferase n=1 Tax=Pedobacter psychroterrae TaxID=2530453 RepID=A0A4R0NNY1_9SPHI|nr:acyltransferase [Pedobacter psychroterrae]TCD01688.1 acyltransferase [Pedobacter psychroterrae]
MKSFLQRIKDNPKLKNIVHWMIIPTNEARPRLWIKWFVNPFFHKRNKGSKVRRRTRMDVMPFNKFELGEYSIIEDFSTINNGVGDVIIGNRTLIGMSNVIIGPVKLGNNIIIAQNVVISGLNHGYQDINSPIANQKISTSVITIEDDCWIAANAVITAGVNIGRHSVIAAGCIVTKSVPAFCVMAGNPGKIIKKYDAQRGVWVKV